MNILLLGAVLTLIAEELNYHGTLNGTSAERGANYGYPECFAAWDPSVIPDNQNINVGTQFPIGSASTDCASRYAPKLCFPSHTAPLGVKFNADGSAVYISFHGSWYVALFRLTRLTVPRQCCTY
jgi:glucose/arabinose dehydrogenase